MEKEGKRDYVMRVGNIEKAMATLVDTEYNVIELPKYLLPGSAQSGSVIRVSLTHDQPEEERRKRDVEKVER